MCWLLLNKLQCSRDKRERVEKKRDGGGKSGRVEWSGEGGREAVDRNCLIISPLTAGLSRDRDVDTHTACQDLSFCSLHLSHSLSVHLIHSFHFKFSLTCVNTCV